ncbi:MAG: fibronectin type III domain-containing protein [Desulfuromonadales bacterium]
MSKLLSIGLVLMAMLQGHEALSASQPDSSALQNSSLSAPLSLRAKPEVNGALLQWQAVNGAEHYRIYWEQGRDVASYSPTLDSISADRISYHVRDLSPGALYKFVVSAVRSSQESPLSIQVGVTPPAEEKKQMLQDSAP